MAAIGRMFLLQPSLVNKSTALLQSRAAALQQLPGLQPETAAAAILAFPALLNLQPGVVAGRWAQLQDVRACSQPLQGAAVACCITGCLRRLRPLAGPC